MGYLTVISETGIFHSACKLEFSDNPRTEWLGWQPYWEEPEKERNKQSVDMARDMNLLEGAPETFRGRIDPVSRETLTNHWVKLKVSDRDLKIGRSRAIGEFRDKPFTGWHNCVDFSRALAVGCGLEVGSVILLPYDLLVMLDRYNEDAVVGSLL